MLISNVRTMEYLGDDFWGRPVYKCIETGSLCKDITLGSENPELYSCGQDFEGEPRFPIKSQLEIHFVGKETEETKLNYMVLGRMKSDCDYYLGFGNRNNSRLLYKDERQQIDEMKKLWNGFPEGKKPDWLSYEDILNYEAMMLQ